MLFFLFFLYEFFNISISLNFTIITCDGLIDRYAGISTNPKPLTLGIIFHNEEELKKFKFFEVTIRNITDGTQDEMYLMDCDETRNLTGVSKTYYQANNTATFRLENFSMKFDFKIKNLYNRIWDNRRKTYVDFKLYGFNSDTIPLEAFSFENSYDMLHLYSDVDCIIFF